jgi:hypothetical protein
VTEKGSEMIKQSVPRHREVKQEKRCKKELLVVLWERKRKKGFRLLWIRIRRIRVFLCLPDLSIIKRK